MQNRDDQDRLIEYHLGWLDDEQRRRAEEQMEFDPELAAEGRALERLFGLLAAYEVDVPPDLTERTIEGVERRLRPVKISPEPVAVVGGGGLSVRDLVAAAAMIAIVLALLVPAYVRAREEGRRAACRAQLRNIGYAVLTYGTTYAGQLPFAGHRAGAYWLPVRKPGTPVSDNDRHLYLLVRMRLAEPEWFVCPDRCDGIVMQADRPEAFRTFPERANCTYSFQCMAGPRPRLTDYPRMPILADQTPVFAGGRYVRPCNPDCNSPNHRSAGQNVLFADGSVQWTTGPKIGIAGDNIWFLQHKGLDEYLGVETPKSPTDAFLVP